jgi:S1-C subfamily serine protease
MKTKIFSIILSIFVVLVYSLYSETQISNIEKDIKEIVKKCSPSVAKVISEDGRKIISSGVVIDKGYILAHSRALHPDKEVFVENYKGEKVKADLIGVDWENFIALLKVDGKYFEVPKFGSLSKVEVGDWVIAIGTSFESFPSASFGIVNSIKGKEFNVSLATPPGGSGSGVFNSKGELIGILRGDISGRDVWISFSSYDRKNIPTFMAGGSLSMIIPVERAREIYEDLKKESYEKKPYLGVTIKEVDGRIIVQSVWKKSPAEKAGVKENDYIISLNGKRIYKQGDLSNMIQERKVGDKVTLEIERDGKLMKKEAVLEEAPKGYFAFPPLPPSPPYPPPIPPSPLKIAPKAYLGVLVDTIPKGIESEKGAYIKRVEDGSPADKAGLKEGDIIISVDKERIFSPDDLVEVIGNRKPGEHVEIGFIRDKKESKCTVTLAKRKEWTWYWDWDDFSNYFELGREKEETEKEFNKRMEDLFERNKKEAEKEYSKMKKELEKAKEELRKAMEALRERFDSIKIMVKSKKEGIEI